MRFFNLILTTGFLISPIAEIFAHSPLDYATMKPRQNASGVKTTVADIDTLPCGPGINATPGPVQHVIKPGSDFEVVWVETIDHPAKYLIDLTSQDPNGDPLSVANPNQVVLMDQDGFYNDTVIPQNMQNILDRVQNPRSTTVENPNPNAVYKVMVKIPADVTCSKCTLRLMQKMFDTGSLANTVYTHCTDVSINAGEVTPSPEPSEKPTKPAGFKVKALP